MATFCQGCANEVASQYRFCPSCGGRSFANVRPSNQAPGAFGAGSGGGVGNASAGNVQAPVRTAYSGFWRRVAAALIDCVVLLVPATILTFGFAAAGFGQDSLVANIVVFLLQWSYFAGMESSERQGTLGKRAMGLRVCDMNGQRISFGKATGRYFGKIVSALILCIGFLMVAFTERKQALHDMMAGTIVLHQAE